MGFPTRRVVACIALFALGLLATPVAAQSDAPGPQPRPDSFVVDGELTEAEAQAEMESYLAAGGWSLEPALYDPAVDALLREIALLVELDAFAGNLPPRFVTIHQAYAPWSTDDRVALVTATLAADDALASLYELIDDRIDYPTLDGALEPLRDIRRNSLVEGRTAFLPSQDYLSALSELLSRGTAEAIVANGRIGIEMIAFLPSALDRAAVNGDIASLVAENDALRAEVAALSASIEADEGGGTWYPWIPLIAASVLLAIGAVAIRSITRSKRRPGGEGAMNPSVTSELLDAHRQLAGVVDEDAIVDIGTSAAMHIAGAHHASIFRRLPEGVRRIGESTLIVQSALDRVIETAQPLVDVIDDDPAIGGPVSVCAVPLVVDGSVVGVLVASANTDMPFDDDDRRHLELLAPALGGALVSADTLDTYENLAMVDGLTSLGNRRRLDGDLATSLADAITGDIPLSFAMIDVDHFKDFNDANGHHAGDAALQAVARAISGAVRDTDVVYRYGGEEFSVLLPGATQAEAVRAAERIREAVESTPIVGEDRQPGGRLTVSIGVADLDHTHPLGLATRADDALYRAKADGRNRTVAG